MTECPNDDCKENFERRISGHDRTLYGPEGTGGVVACVKTKVSKRTLYGSVISFVGIFAMLMIAGLTAWGNAKDERKQTKENLSVLQSRFEMICNDIVEIKQQQQKIIENQINPKELLNEIRKILEDSGQ